jgi:hypothetical protein
MVGFDTPNWLSAAQLASLLGTMWPKRPVVPAQLPSVAITDALSSISSGIWYGLSTSYAASHLPSIQTAVKPHLFFLDFFGGNCGFP